MKNDVTSFFFYMWNKWRREECEVVYGKGCLSSHFWNKWVYICKQYGTYGATERFYAELSENNRALLVARAIECYDGMREIK